MFPRSWANYMDLFDPYPEQEYVAYKRRRPVLCLFQEVHKEKIVSGHGSGGYYSLNFPESGSAPWHFGCVEQ